MARILFVGNAQLLDENIRFLLSRAGFELTQVRDVEEAINLIEINESFNSAFTLLLLPMATVVNKNRQYIELLVRLGKRIKILMLVRKAEIAQLQTEFGEISNSKSIVVVSEENALSEIKSFVGRNESVEKSTSLFRGGKNGA